MNHHQIECTDLSQEDLLESGCLDLSWAIDRPQEAVLAFRRGEVLFPEKIDQIFNQETQERINCLPATLLKEKICGVKWASVFPPNPVRHARQNLSAVKIPSEIEKGFPVAFMGRHSLLQSSRGGRRRSGREISRPGPTQIIGFIGTGKQAKMHLLGMKAARPSLEECRVMARRRRKKTPLQHKWAPCCPGCVLRAPDAMAGAPWPKRTS